MAKTYRQAAAERRRDPERRGRVEREKALILAGMRLYELRKEQGLSQTEVARRLGVSQERISKLERAEDVKLSTLQSYVEALGGHLEVSAVIGDETIALSR
jgi:DNA-binding XRE family transcriptional regulator